MTLPLSPSMIWLRPKTGQKHPVSFFWAQNCQKGGRAYVKKPAQLGKSLSKCLILETDFFKGTARNMVIIARILLKAAHGVFLPFAPFYHYLSIYLIEKKEKSVNKRRMSENLTLRGIRLKLRDLHNQTVVQITVRPAQFRSNARKSAQLFLMLNQCVSLFLVGVRGFERHFCPVPFFSQKKRVGVQPDFWPMGDKQ